MASWKKIIVSGSDAHLNSVTASAFGGNISGSSTSTGSFGHLNAVGGALIGTGSNQTLSGITSGEVDLLVRPNVAGGDYTTRLVVEQGNSHSYKSDAEIHLHGFNDGRFYIGGNRQRKIIFKTNAPNASAAEAWTIGTPDDSTNFQISALNSTVQAILINKTSGNITAVGNISSSITSTGSFGRVEATKFVGDGSGLTGLTSAAIETYNNSGDNRILTSVNSTTVQGEAGLTFDGTELRVQGDVVAENFIVSSSVTFMTQSFSSGSTIFGDSIDDTHVFTGSLLVTGSQTLVGRITPTEIGAFTAKGAIDFDNQNMTNVDIDSGDIASGVTINKSPVVNFNSGDVQGSITLTNLATGTGGLTIQADSVEGTMLNTNVADTSTIELSSDTLSVLKVPNALTAGTGIDAGGTFDGAAARTFNVNLAGLSSHTIGASTSEITIGDNLTVVGNLTVQGDTVQQQIANLNVEDRFILLNSGSAAGDGGLVVQTESTNDGVAFAYDDSESRWGFQQGTKLSGDATAVAPDAYASAVVTSDDSNYQKNGNIRVEGGEIYIYVE